MNILEIIARKRDGRELTGKELRFAVEKYLQNEITDYQFAALLMAIYLRGMTTEEIFQLTRLMRDSGEKLSFPELRCFKVDKHSTGGVGDKISFLIAPLLASFGFCCLMLSGRALGHTGGTLDKLESIPGFKTLLTPEEFRFILKQNQMVISGQTASLTPADQKIYALRDATATVSSIPLIAASIMSKKLAVESDLLLLEVKCGSGAFLKTKSAAIKLARIMLKIARQADRDCKIIITDMSEPLGLATGNSIEIIEAIEFLKGNCPADLLEITSALAFLALQKKMQLTYEQALEEVKSKIKSGEPLQFFKKFIALQNGNPQICENYQLFPQPEIREEITALNDGFLKELNAYQFGMALIEMKGGRLKKEDKIDPSAGILFKRKCGDYVRAGDVICTLYGNDRSGLEFAKKRLLRAIKISPQRVEKRSKILYYLDEKGLKPWIKFIQS